MYSTKFALITAIMFTLASFASLEEISYQCTTSIEELKSITLRFAKEFNWSDDYDFTSPAVVEIPELKQLIGTVFGQTILNRANDIIGYEIYFYGNDSSDELKISLQTNDDLTKPHDYFGGKFNNVPFKIDCQ